MHNLSLLGEERFQNENVSLSYCVIDFEHTIALTKFTAG